MSLTNLETAVNNLFLAKAEFGYNKQKETKLIAAQTALSASLAGDSSLTGAAAIASVKKAMQETKFAIEAGNGRGTGSGFLTTEQKIQSETLHTQAALAAADAALKAPAV
jgi:hypothetical protein